MHAQGLREVNAVRLVPSMGDEGGKEKVTIKDWKTLMKGGDRGHEDDDKREKEKDDGDN